VSSFNFEDELLDLPKVEDDVKASPKRKKAQKTGTESPLGETGEDYGSEQNHKESKKKAEKKKEYRLNASQREVVEILRTESLQYLQRTDDFDGSILDEIDSGERARFDSVHSHRLAVRDILTVKSAFSLVKSTKVKGLHVEKLVDAMNREMDLGVLSSLQNSYVDQEVPAAVYSNTMQMVAKDEHFLTLLELKNTAEEERVHKVVAFPKGVSERTEEKNGSTNKVYRITLIADGIELGAKIQAKKMGDNGKPAGDDEAKLNEIVEIAKNAKNKYPVIFKIFCSSFNPVAQGKDKWKKKGECPKHMHSQFVRYYQILDAEQVTFD
jgi:hypothetical protein